MSRLLAVVALSLLLSGCFNDLNDVKQYIAKVKANTKARVEPLPEVKEFVHIPYRSADVRSPFAIPRPETVQDKFVQLQDCLHPDPRRSKEPLEKYALDNLKMRGTLGDTGNIWALIEASDKTFHRVTVGNYLGLFHGRVRKVAATEITLQEMIPDGTGCWKERTTVLQMTDISSAAN